MAFGSRQKLAAIFGSLAAVGGAFAIQHVVKKSATSVKTPSAVDIGQQLQQLTTRLPSGNLDSAIRESRKLLTKLQQDSGCPGLAVTVSLNGKTVWKEGFGLADLENGVECSPDSVMKIASISKPITMMLVAREWETGALDLDADVRQYVPYWPEKLWDGEKVILTPRQLCSHMAGIRDYKPKVDSTVKCPTTEAQDDFQYEEYYITKEYKNVKESLDIFKDDPLVSKPGTEFNYTTHGFSLLSAVLEGATSKKFIVLIEDLLKDLGLSSTCVDDKNKIRYNSARHYVKGADGAILNAPFTETSFQIAAAGLLSTTNDLVKFGNMLLYSFQQRAEPRGYLRPTTVEMLWTPVANTRVSWDPQGRYGMGWQIVSGSGERYVGHTGEIVGASSALVMSLDKYHAEGGTPRGVVVAVLCNLQGVGLGSVAVKIANNFLKFM